MDEFNYLQFLNDDSELLEAEEVLLGEFPTFSVQFDEYFDNFFLRIRSGCVRSRVQQQRDKSRANSESTKCRFYQVPWNLKRRNWRAQGCCRQQKYLPLDKTVDECIQKSVPVSTCRKCKHRNNGAGRAWQHPKQVLRWSKKKGTEMITSRNALKSCRVPRQIASTRRQFLCDNKERGKDQTNLSLSLRRKSLPSG